MTNKKYKKRRAGFVILLVLILLIVIGIFAVKGEINGGKEYVTVKTFNGVRYTVPQKISKSHKGELILRMRVNNVYKKVNLVVKNDKDETVFSKFRQIVTPGEMETVVLSADTVEKIKESAYISVGLEGKA